MRYRWESVRKNTARPAGAGLSDHTPRKLVLGESFELSARTDDGSLAFFAKKVNAAVGEHGRCRMVAADAFGPEEFAGPGIEARGDAVVRHGIKFCAGQKGRALLRHQLRDLPRDATVGYVAAPVDADCPKLVAGEIRAHVDHTVPEHRRGNVRVALPVIHLPQRLAGCGLVSDDPFCPWDDELGLVAVPDEQRAAEAFLELVVQVDRWPVRFPDRRAGSADRARRRTARRNRRAPARAGSRTESESFPAPPDGPAASVASRARRPSPRRRTRCRTCRSRNTRALARLPGLEKRSCSAGR